jgi:hypothetical protein
MELVQFGYSSAPVLIVLVTLVGWAGPFACAPSPLNGGSGVVPV